MQNEYRIVRSAPMLFELQIKRWWWPIWMMIHWFHDEESAEKFALGHAGGVVKNLGTMLEGDKA